MGAEFENGFGLDIRKGLQDPLHDRKWLLRHDDFGAVESSAHMQRHSETCLARSVTHVFSGNPCKLQSTAMPTLPCPVVGMAPMKGGRKLNSVDGELFLVDQVRQPIIPKGLAHTEKCIGYLTGCFAMKEKGVNAKEITF